jgi:hypothetical protein
MGRIHMNRGRVGEERGGKEMDRCPLTDILDIDDTRLQEMEHSLAADGDEKDAYHNLTDHITKSNTPISLYLFSSLILLFPSI